MNVLFINHFYEQDIESLIAAAPQGTSFCVVPAAHWGNSARNCFPPHVFSSLSAYWEPEMQRARERWDGRARALLWDLYHQFPFDVIVAPSDSFFYMFSVVDEARRMGIPFVVAQKETTITDHSMAVHSERVRKWAPFSADAMTVCSERHKKFWVRAGGQPDRIVVTGQPRFDFYYQGHDRTTTEQGSLLFLSYHLDAYADTAQGDAVRGSTPWGRLRTETMEVLYDLATSRGLNFIVKPHPQQDREDIESIRRDLEGRVESSGRLRARVAEPNEDTRILIKQAETVVGFQTTALFEALAAGKRTIYTGWSDELTRQKEGLIPFHEWSHFIHVANSPDDLRRLIERSAVHQAPDAGWSAAYHEYLGPTDGKASERTWTVICRTTQELDDNKRHQRGYRARIEGRARAWKRKEIVRGRVEQLLVKGLVTASRRGRLFGGSKVTQMEGHWSRRISELASPDRLANPRRLVARSFTTIGGLSERWIRTRFNAW